MDKAGLSYFENEVTVSGKRDATINFLLSLLVLSSFASIFTVEVGSSSVNLTQIVSIIVFLLLFLYQLLVARNTIILHTDPISLLIYLYFLTNVFSSILFSQHRGQSLKNCVVILSYVLIYLTVKWSIKFIVDKELFVRRLQQFNLMSAGYGLLALIVAVLTGKEVFGTTYSHLAQSGMAVLGSDIPSIYSLSIEPNLFAIITAAILCIHVSVFFLWRKTAANLFVIILLSLAVVFAYTRSVYISLGLALFIMVILSRRLKLIFSLLGYAVVAGAVITIIYLYLPEENEIKASITNRIGSLLDFKKGSGLARVHGYEIGFKGFKDRPIFGNGTLSAPTTFYNPYEREYQNYMGSPGWLNGTLIQSLHDTGLVGFLVVLGIFASVIYSNYRVFAKLGNDDVNKSIVLGFIGGGFIFFISSQLSSTLWFSFTYVYWAINMTYLSGLREKLNDSTAQLIR